MSISFAYDFGRLPGAPSDFEFARGFAHRMVHGDRRVEKKQGLERKDEYRHEYRNQQGRLDRGYAAPIPQKFPKSA